MSVSANLPTTSGAALVDTCRPPPLWLAESALVDICRPPALRLTYSRRYGHPWVQGFIKDLKSALQKRVTLEHLGDNKQQPKRGYFKDCPSRQNPSKWRNTRPKWRDGGSLDKTLLGCLLSYLNKIYSGHALQFLRGCVGVPGALYLCMLMHTICEVVCM